MKELKTAKITDPKAYEHIARCEVYQAISDYEIWSRIYMKDPSDEEAFEMMMDCEEFILTDPRVELCISDPVEFLWETDRRVERDIRKWKKEHNL